MIQATFKWAYILLLPLGVLSVTMNFYRVSKNKFNFNVNHAIKISRSYCEFNIIIRIYKIYTYF